MLDNALDLGLSEEQFWNMTVGELDRFVSSKARQTEARLKERATMDYTQAILIGIAINGTDKDHPFPELYDIYPELFKQEKEEQNQARIKQQEELSAIRFMQFAKSFNAKFDKGGK